MTPTGPERELTETHVINTAARHHIDTHHVPFPLHDSSLFAALWIKGRTFRCITPSFRSCCWIRRVFNIRSSVWLMHSWDEWWIQEGHEEPVHPFSRMLLRFLNRDTEADLWATALTLMLSNLFFKAESRCFTLLLKSSGSLPEERSHKIPFFPLKMSLFFLFLRSTLDDECGNLRQQKLDRQVRLQLRTDHLAVWLTSLALSVSRH